MRVRISGTALFLAAFLLFGGIVRPATAGVIDFESAAGYAAVYTEDGFTLSSGHSNAVLHFDYYGNDVATQNDTIALWNHDYVVTLTRGDGALFSFESFDGAELFARNSCCPYYNPTSLKVTGMLANGSTVSQSFTLDQVSDGLGGAADFQSFSLMPDFTSLTSVRFEGIGTYPNNFALDNLAASAIAPVPEPATLFLLGAGIACVSAGRRKGRRRAPADS
jgi:hypothetical protein